MARRTKTNLPSRSSVGDSRILLGSSNREGIVNHHGTHVNVIVGSGRSMDDHGTADTVTVLGQRVRVIPASAVLVELHGVGAGRARSNTTLGDTWHAVLVVGGLLSQTWRKTVSTLFSRFSISSVEEFHVPCQ